MKLAKRALILLAIVLLLVGFLVGRVSAKKDDKPEEVKKVFVCKYVGKPGEDERLQTGQNPINVSVNSIKDYQGVGSYFNDAQGRSYVLAEDIGQPEPSVDKCPKPDTKPEEPKEEPKETPTTPQVTTVPSGGVDTGSGFLLGK